MEGFIPNIHNNSEGQSPENCLKLQAFLTTIIKEVMEAIILVDRQQTIVFFNSEAERMFGWQASEVLGKPMVELITNWYSQAGFDPTHLLQPSQFSARRSNGVEFPVDLKARWIDCDQTSFILISLRDVSLRLEAEKGLHQIEEEFRQLQKMEALGRLVSGVTHDFNNILTSILSLTELVLMDFDDTNPNKADLEEIQREAQRAATLTKQLLIFSRKQSQRQYQVNLNDIVACQEKLFHRLLGEDIELECLLEPNLPLITAYPGQIEQVIMNLVVNARDAMPGGGAIRLETSEVNVNQNDSVSEIPPGNYICLVIADNGTGMNEATQQRIFEPFFTTKEAGNGTGLGLSTVKTIITNHKGYISVQSQPGKGTTFKIYLPQFGAKHEPVLSKSTSASKKSDDFSRYAFGTNGNGSASPGEKPRVALVVEDERVVRELISRLLIQQGYLVMQASQAEQAIALCNNYAGPIDLLITDIGLPGSINGLKLAEKVRQLKPETQMFYISGYSHRHNGYSFSGRSRTSLNFLEKPFTASTFLERLQAIRS